MYTFKGNWNFRLNFVLFCIYMNPELWGKHPASLIGQYSFWRSILHLCDIPIWRPRDVIMTMMRLD